MSKTLKTRIVNKHDTEANWKLATTFIPKDGEIIIYDPDSSYSESRVKIGDGKTAVGSLSFLDENQAASLSMSNYTIQLKNNYGANIGDSVTVPRYTLPTATSSTLGGVKTGSNITNTSGVISLTKSNVTNALGYTPPTTNTTYSEATTDASGLMSADDKTKLDGIATEANKYTLPAATSSTLGGVKVGSNITNSSGAISLTKSNVTTALGYTPINSAMGGASSSAAGSTGLVPAPAKGEQGLYLRGDGEWATPTNTTYSTATTSSNGLMSSTDKSKLDGIASNANNYTYTLPAATSSALGGVKVGSNITNASGTISISKSNVTNALGYTPPTTNTTYSVMGGASSSAAGSSGLVPAPAKGNQGQYLRGDGTWSTPTNTTYSAATSSSNGLMSSTDKAKLDGIASGANNYTYTLPTATSLVLGGVKTGSNITNSSGTISITKSNVTSALGYTPATQNAFTGASTNTSGTAVAGSSGLVPAPDAGEDGLYLKGDGSWGTPTNTTYSNATTSAAGLMSSTDKSKLDGIASGANKYTLPNATSSTLGGVKIGSNITVSSGTISLSKSNITSALGYTPPTTDTNTTYDEATTDVSGLMSASDKSKLDGIATGANNYSLPAATSSVLGGVKIGSNITNSSGTISLSKSNVTNALGYTPPTTDTTYSVATTSANGLMSSTDKSKLDGIASGANAYSLPTATSSVLGGVKVGSNITLSSGVISLTSTNVTNALGYTPPTTNTTYSEATTSASGLMSSTDKSKLDGIATNANNYSLPTATSSVLGGVKVGSNITLSSGKISLSKSNVTSALGYTPPTSDTTYSVFTGATSSADGSTGLIPAPATGEQGLYLRGDGEWATPTNTTYSAATTSSNGLMTAAMVTKLNGIATGANAYSLPSATSSILGGVKIGSNISVSSGVISLSKSNVTSALGYTPPTTNTTYSVMGAASSSAAGSSGLVPAPAKGEQGLYLRGDGEWATPTDTTYSAATTSASGLMTAAMVTKLNGIATSANNYSHPTSSGNKHIPSGGSSGQILRWSADGTAVWGSDNNTTYSVATTSANGLMSSTDKSKLDGIATGANAYSHPTYTAKSSGLYKVTVDSTGHVSAATAVAKSDITALGIPSSDTNTTYDVFEGPNTTAGTSGTEGLVPAPDNGEESKFLRGDGLWATPTDTNTTYSAGTGISLSGTTFSNSGVRSVSTGSSNGTISVNTGGTTSSVSVKGLGTAAYTASTAYAASSHTHSYLPLSGGTTTGTTTLASHLKVAYESSTVKIYFVS